MAEAKNFLPPLVCVIVLNYNGRDHLDYCLPSLLATNYSNYRILLVDNASSDGSREMVAARHPEILIVASPRNVGWSGGNNLGIAKAAELGARYVVMANNDIKVDARWLQEAVAVAESDPRIGVLGFEVFEADGRLDNDGDFLAARQRWESVKFLPAGDVGGMSMFVRTALFEEIGVIDEGYFVYGEENDFQLRAEAAGYRAVSINVPVWHYGQGFFGKVPTRAAMLQTRSKIRLLIKHGSLSATIRGGFRHFFNRVVNVRPRPGVSVVERRLRPSKNPLVNLWLLSYCVAWNLWFLPNTLQTRRRDYRRARLVRHKWA